MSEKSIKNMIFTSAGDNTNLLEWWISNSQNYDIYILYYGNNDEIYKKYKSNVKYIEKSKGSKFQNLYKFYTEHPEIISKYDYFFVVDDDIQIKASDINELFKMAKDYKLLICAPSFSSSSKISWPHTKHKPNCLLTYTNMIEENTFLFKRSALDNYMKMYNPKIIAWGMDFLSIWANGLHKKKSYAIIHKITCTNPKDTDKKDTKRELNKAIKSVNIKAEWEKYADSIGCPRKIKVIEYSSLRLRQTRKLSKDKL